MQTEEESLRKYEHKIRWIRVFLAVVVTSGGSYALYNIVKGQIGSTSLIFTLITFLVGGIGTGPGVHRYFCHRSYKCKYGLKLFLLFCQQVSGLTSTINWTTVHRVHHKYSDTDKDPTNIKRGFFFSFFGWIFIEPTEEYVKEASRVYLEDLLSDKLIVLQHKYYPFFYTTITFILPTFFPYYFWNESLLIAFSLNMLRYSINIFMQMVGNSFVHWNGSKPYDATQTAVDSVLYNYLTLGEGYHNFHHAFPFDYRSNHLYSLHNINSLSTFVIDIFALIGLAFDLRTASPDMIEKRMKRTGDGSLDFDGKAGTF